MLSKQEKLKYGQMLRQQMKQKQQKKKLEEMDKRGIKKNNNQHIIYPQKQNNTQSNQKQSLQRKFQTVDYGPFGRPGAGAPNRHNEQNNHHDPHSINSNQLQNQSKQLQFDNLNRFKTQEQDHSFNQYQRNHLNPDGYPPNFQKPPIRQNIQEYNHNLGSQKKPIQQQYLRHNNQYNPNNNYIPQNNDYYSQNQKYYQNIPTNQPLIPTYGNAYQLNQYSDRSKIQNYQQNYSNNNYPPQQYSSIQQDDIRQNNNYQKPYEQINKRHEQNRQKTLQNQQITEIHKKGGRNLLLLQNMTAQQHIIKQKQKLQMQKQLKLQMEEAQKRKRQQKQRRQREQRQQQIKNQQYLQRQKQKILQEQRAKDLKQKQIIEQNVRNLQQRKRLQEEARKKANQLKNKSFQNKPQIERTQQKEVFSKQAQFQVTDETQSQGSSSTVMERAFNTDVSRQFFQKERRRDQQRYNREKNLQVVTDQIKKMRDQIDRQNQLFKKQIQKVKFESESAQIEKRKAQQQIENLKDQLKKKMEDDNQRLFLALQRQEKLKNQSEVYQLPTKKQKKKHQYYQEQNYDNQFTHIPKAKKNQSLVNKKYVIPQQVNQSSKYNPNLEQSNFTEDGQDGLQSLHGQSKKIPLNIDDPKLSMSRLSDYARQTQFFKNPQSKKKSTNRIQESIVQQEEQRIQSRAINRNKIQNIRKGQDELDKMIQSRQKSRGGWGQLSSVNQDITKQIQELLKKKQGKNERPTSHLSNAGRQALSRHGLEYQGQSLATINTGGNGTINTLDYDRIHNRNEARLNQLRNLGVQTINTNNDEQFSKLDQILNKYKHDRSRVL